MSITVTKPYLPPKDEYLNYVSEIFDRGILTNQGANVRALEAKRAVCFFIKFPFCLLKASLNYGERTND